MSLAIPVDDVEQDTPVHDLTRAVWPVPKYITPRGL
jgi:hypothetical protein